MECHRTVRRSRRCVAVVAAIVLFAGAGCGHVAEGPPTVPAAGKLLVDGQPAVGAQVILHPADGQDFDRRGSRPTGRVADDGSFRVTTYQPDDGAPVGRYLVTVYWAQDPASLEPSPDRLQGRYLDPEMSELTVEIAESTTHIPPIELKSP